MIRQTIALACVSVLVPAAAAQQYQVEVLPGSTGYHGPFTMFCPGSGSLVGDWDPITNPAGTRSKPGDSGPFLPHENEPVPATPWLVHVEEISSIIAGGFGFEVNAFFEYVEVTGMSLDLLGGAELDLAMESSLSHETFRTLSPEGLFPADSIAGTMIPGSRFVELTFTQTAAAEGTHEQVDPFTALFGVTVPGVISGSIGVADSVVMLPDIPAEFILSGEVVQHDSISIIGFGTIVGDMTGAGGQAWSAPIEVALPDGSGATAGLIASASIEDVIAAFELTFSGFEAESIDDCFADCDGDGVPTVFDFLCFQNQFAGGSLEADCDADGRLTLFDFLCFQTGFEMGCP